MEGFWNGVTKKAILFIEIDIKRKVFALSQKRKKSRERKRKERESGIMKWVWHLAYLVLACFTFLCVHQTNSYLLYKKKIIFLVVCGLTSC